MFLGLAADVVARARGGDRYSKVRWWGEMVNVLWERGEVAASMNLEDLFDQLAQSQDIAIFCSFLMDNFNGDIQSRILPRLERTILTLSRSKIMRGWNEPWLTLCVTRSDRMKLESLKVNCSPDILRPSTCREHKHCCWHCVRFFHLFLIPYSSVVASCIRPESQDGEAI